MELLPSTATPQGHWSHPASTSPPAYSPAYPTWPLGGSSRLLGCQVPPPASGRGPSCGEVLTPWPPTLPFDSTLAKLYSFTEENEYEKSQCW